MEPLGYVIMQAGMRLSRPVKAYERWVERMPVEYQQAMLGEDTGRDDEPRPTSTTSTGDPHCLGVMRHYQSLMPLAQDARKPMFHLRPADGAIGAHMDAVRRCREDFERLACSILGRANEMEHSSALTHAS